MFRPIKQNYLSTIGRVVSGEEIILTITRGGYISRTFRRFRQINIAERGIIDLVSGIFLRHPSVLCSKALQHKEPD